MTPLRIHVAEPRPAGEGAVPALETRGLRVTRGRAPIVEGLDLTVRAGQIAWLTGPNGVGKSSLMRVLAGLDPPMAGSVARRPFAAAGRRAVGYYQPAMSLPPEPRARAFVRLAETLVAPPHPMRPERELEAKRVSNLSTGEAKRLLLGPILAAGRPFLFLDEPYEHLSVRARDELTRRLRELAAGGRVVVIATNQPLPAGERGPVLELSIRGPNDDD